MRAAHHDTPTSDEPRFAPTLRDVLGRAVRRPLRTAAVALLVTGILVALRVAAEPVYEATLTFRMEEGNVQEAEATPSPPRLIREHISNIALNRRQLLRLMEQHGISPRLRIDRPEAAVAALRDDIDVTVVRNYFLNDRRRDDAPRSAHVVISFRGGDRAYAAAIVHDIGAIVLESQAAARSVPMEVAGEFGAYQVRLARAQLEALERQRARLLASRTGGAPDVRAELASQRELEGALARLRDLERRSLQLELAREAEQQRLGLTFQLVDERVRAIREPVDAARAVGLAIVALLVATPIIAILLGAFDDRIYRGADVTSHGFPLLGTVPRVPLPARARPTPRREARQRKRFL